MMGTHMRGRSGALAASALMLTACGGSTGSGNPSFGGSPQQTTSGSSASRICKLIGRQEAFKALGQDPGAPQFSPPSGCGYEVGSTEALAWEVVDDGAKASTLFNQQRTTYSGRQGFQDITGVGDRAFFIRQRSDPQHHLAHLHQGIDSRERDARIRFVTSERKGDDLAGQDRRRQYVR